MIETENIIIYHTSIFKFLGIVYNSVTFYDKKTKYVITLAWARFSPFQAFHRNETYIESICDTPIDYKEIVEDILNMDIKWKKIDIQKSYITRNEMHNSIVSKYKRFHKINRLL